VRYGRQSRLAALAKRFGSVYALDGMDLTVQAGEVHGFLGPNGAGKTTTLRILSASFGVPAARRSFWVATRGSTTSSCTSIWRTSRATSHSGPTSPAVK
jgi:ABC-type branched-subunit amino acid transport system ATPase component